MQSALRLYRVNRRRRKTVRLYCAVRKLVKPYSVSSFRCEFTVKISLAIGDMKMKVPVPLHPSYIKEFPKLSYFILKMEAEGPPPPRLQTSVTQPTLALCRLLK